MKIAYSLASHTEGGGVMRVMSTKINALIDRGYDVSVIVNSYNGSSPFFKLDPRVKVLSLDLEPFIWKNSLFKRFLFAVKRIFKYRTAISKVLNKEKFDIVLVHNRIETLLVPFVKDASLKVLEHHGPKTEYQNIIPNRKVGILHRCLTSFYEFRDHVFASFFDKIVVLTEKDKVLRGGGNKIEVIPNLVSFSNFQECSQVNKSSKNVLAVGRFTEEKDFASLLHIWRLVVDTCPDWHLNIVGDGYLRGELEDLILKYNLQDSVSLLGEQKNVDEFYLNSAIYAMTSRYEGLPMVLIEAQYFCLPAVAFDCPCGPSGVIIDGKNGFLIPPNDKEAFALRLVQLIQDLEFRSKMGGYAKDSATRFEVNVVMPQWEDLFYKLRNKKNEKYSLT